MMQCGQNDATLILLRIFLVFLSYFVFSTQGILFEFKNCDDTPIQVNTMQLDLLYPNGNYSASPKLNLTVDLTNTNYKAVQCKTRFYLSYKLQRKIGSFLPERYFSLPCIDRWVGSCNRKINCKQLFGCPWQEGRQTFTSLLSQGFEIPDELKGEFINGKYMFSAELREVATGEKVACMVGTAVVKQ